DRKRRDEEVKERISAKLTESGERERMKEPAAAQAQVIRNKGIDQVTVDDLIEEITPKARDAVPESIRNEMLEKIKAFIEKSA
ncbi:hypothetical protein PINS_up024254, partial [Pythium insidiosum]